MMAILLMLSSSGESNARRIIPIPKLNNVFVPSFISMMIHSRLNMNLVLLFSHFLKVRAFSRFERRARCRRWG